MEKMHREVEIASDFGSEGLVKGGEGLANAERKEVEGLRQKLRDLEHEFSVAVITNRSLLERFGIKTSQTKEQKAKERNALKKIKTAHNDLERALVILKSIDLDFEERDDMDEK